MAPLSPSLPASGRQAWKLVLFMMLRMGLSLTALLMAYVLIPTRNPGRSADWPWLTLELCVFGVIVGIQVPAIVKAKYPVLRAIESLAILVPLYLLIFARVYLSNSLGDPTAFNQPLDKTTALYFTVTVFATVGFGDIVAKVDSMRLLVTLQMLLNLVLLGLVIRLLAASARQGITRRRGQADLGESGHLGD
jgi:hypothetical protein